MLSPVEPGNRILAALSAADVALLQPDLRTVDLTVRRQLEQRNRPIENIYFFDSGLGSMVASAAADQSIEVAMIGNEGMTGLAVLLNTDRSPFETFIQTAGSGRSMEVEKFRSALDRSVSLHRTCLRYAQTLVTQMGHTALANGRYKIEERLARWLLMADDRSGGLPLNLTHEILSLMLGTRRAGVSVALQKFQKRGTIETERGSILIKDHRTLKEIANGSYGAPEAEYARLFGIRALVNTVNAAQ